jgi:hypothetical protein
LRGVFLTSDFAGTFLDGAEAFTRGYRQLYFIDVLQSATNATEIHLMNIGAMAAAVDLYLTAADGSVLKGPIKRSIPARGKLGESVATLFGYGGELRSAHVKAVANDDVLAGFGLISHGAGAQPDALFGLNALPQENAGSILYSPQLAVGDLGVHYDTRLNIANVGEFKTTVTVELLDENGHLLAAAANYADLPPGAHFSLDVARYFSLNLAQGYIKVSASGGGKLLGNVLFGDGDPTMDRLSFGAALPLYASGASRFVFAHLTQSLGYYTGLAFLAPEGAQVTVESFSGDGTAKGGPATFSLARGQRLATMLQTLIPETEGQMGGYVKVASDLPLIGFELFGSSERRVLAAVPPQRLGK